MKVMQCLVKATVLCTLAISAAAHADSSVMVSDCWVRLLPGNLPAGAYFSVMNMADKSIDLTGVKTEAYGMVMLHRTVDNGNTSSMIMIDKATVPAGGTLKFAPGGYHVMLEQPKQPVKVGATLPLTFSFSDGETITSQCQVKGPAAGAN